MPDIKKPKDEFQLTDELALFLGIAAPVSQEERNTSVLYRRGVLRKALEYLQTLKARVDELEAKSLISHRKLTEQLNYTGELREQNKRLNDVLKRIADDYFTEQVEGEPEWKWLDRELTATKEYARANTSGEG